MTVDSAAVGRSAADARAGAPAAWPATRPFFWSVRRELWENRSIYIAPLAAAAVFLFGFAMSFVTAPARMRATAALDIAKQRAAIIAPYSTAAVLIMFTGFVVALFYCLDALHGERRDRSILFWKSLPVSDRTAVLAKATVPLLVLPLVTSAVVFVTQLVMLPPHAIVRAASGVGAAKLWTELPLFHLWVVQPYGVLVHALWHAPLYAWLLLVSAWARRTPFLWAVLPPIAVAVFERVAFDSSYFAALLGHRVMGAMRVAFTTEAARAGHVTQVWQLDPLRFLTSAGLWLGLLCAAVFLAAAIRLRRDRGPI